MPRKPSPDSQRAVATAFHIGADRLCRLLKRNPSVDYRDKTQVAAMLKRSATLSPETRRAVEAVLAGHSAPSEASSPPPSIEAAEQAAARLETKAGSIAEAEEMLAKLKASMATAERVSEQLRRDGNFEDARRWLVLHQALARQYPALHAQILKLRERHKELVSCRDAERLFVNFLRRMRDLAERMPAGLAGRVAPHDPDGAREQLEIWVREVFCKNMAQAPSVV